MSNDESSKNENNINSEEDESLEKKQQNLLQVNEITEKDRKYEYLIKKEKKKI